MAQYMTEGEDPLDFFSDILNKIPSPEHRAKAGALIEWIAETYPSLVPYIGWNQPMFTHHGTFILGMSFAKNHLSLTPEAVGMQKFSNDVDALGLSKTDGLFRVKWSDEMPLDLIGNMIEFNLEDKKEVTSFWRDTQEWDGQ